MSGGAVPTQCPDCGAPVEPTPSGAVLQCEECWYAGWVGPETVTTAAIRVDGEVWTLPRPTRHHVLAHAWSLAHWRDGAPAPLYRHDSGFMTSNARFVGREEAEAIARAAGQLTGPLIGGVLTSEDLW